MLSFALPTRAEEVWYWNLVQTAKHVSLFVGGVAPREESDADLHIFNCVPKSGKINVLYIMSDPLRLKIADAMKEDKQLSLSLGREPNFQSYHLRSFYSDMDGWMYDFTASADDSHFKTFRKSGVFAFKVNDLVVEISKPTVKRVELVGKFIDACAEPRKKQ